MDVELSMDNRLVDKMGRRKSTVLRFSMKNLVKKSLHFDQFDGFGVWTRPSLLQERSVQRTRQRQSSLSGLQVRQNCLKSLNICKARGLVDFIWAPQGARDYCINSIL